MSLDQRMAGNSRFMPRPSGVYPGILASSLIRGFYARSTSSQLCGNGGTCVRSGVSFENYRIQASYQASQFGCMSRALLKFEVKRGSTVNS